jgi:hypothetical protein
MQTEKPFKADISPEKPLPEPPPETSEPKLSVRAWQYIGLFGVLWLVIAVAGWFAVHRPFSVEVPDLPFNLNFVLGIGRTLAIPVLLFAMVFGCTAFGLRWLAWLRLSENRAVYLSNSERALLAFASGCGAVIVLILVVGMLGGVYWFVGYIGLALLVLANPRQSLWLLRGVIKLPSLYSQWWRNAEAWERWLAVYLILVTLIPLILCGLPPYAWDALMYHLVTPKLHIEEGAVRRLFEIVPASYPGGMHMLFMWAMLLLDDGLAQAWHWLFGVAVAIGLWQFVMRFFTNYEPRKRQQVALLSVTLFLSLPMVQILMSWAYTDLMIAFYTLLSTFVFLLAVQRLAVSGDTTVGWLIFLSGLLSGISYGGKYTAVIASAAIFVGGVYYAYQNKLTFGKLFNWLLLFGAGWLLLVAPWFIRNTIMVGNPVAPLFFGVQGWTADELAPILQKENKSTMTLLGLFTRPWEMTVLGSPGTKFDGTVTPFFIALFPFWLLVCWRNRLLSSLAVAVGLLYLGFLAIITVLGGGGLEHNRIILPAFPWIALLTAVVFFRVGEIKPLKLLNILLVFSFSLFIINNVISSILGYATFNPAAHLMGLQSRQANLEGGLLGNQIRAAKFVNTLPPDSNTYLFFEPRSYYFNGQVAPDLNGRQLYDFYAKNFDSAEAVWQELKRRGYSHILLAEWGYNFFKQELEATPLVLKGNALMDKLVSDYATRLYEDKGQYSVFKLK